MNEVEEGCRTLRMNEEEEECAPAFHNFNKPALESALGGLTATIFCVNIYSGVSDVSLRKQ